MGLGVATTDSTSFFPEFGTNCQVDTGAGSVSFVLLRPDGEKIRFFIFPSRLEPRVTCQ